MTLILLDGALIILLLFGIKAVVEFYEKYKEFLILKEELRGVLRHVQHAMKMAQETVDVLQKNITFASTHITPHLPKAQTLKDDLEFLTDHASSLADRLENLTRDIKQNHLRPQAAPVAQASSYASSSQNRYQRYDERHIQKSDYKNEDDEESRRPLSRYAHPQDYHRYQRHQDEEESLVERKGFVTTIRRAR